MSENTKKIKDCCEKCNEYYEGGDFDAGTYDEGYFCNNKSCPDCHKPQEEKNPEATCNKCGSLKSFICKHSSPDKIVEVANLGHNLYGNGEHRPDCKKCSKKEEWQSSSLYETKLYRTYNGLIQRCTNKKWSKYHLYGGRGIKCEWTSFHKFFLDMYPSFEKHLEKYGSNNTSIDRIDNDGNYSKENCRWATRQIQGNNKGNNSHLTFKGETFTITEWARRCSMPVGTLFTRICTLKWDISRALSTPRGKRTKKVLQDNPLSNL